MRLAVKVGRTAVVQGCRIALTVCGQHERRCPDAGMANHGNMNSPSCERTAWNKDVTGCSSIEVDGTAHLLVNLHTKTGRSLSQCCQDIAVQLKKPMGARSTCRTRSSNGFDSIMTSAWPRKDF